MSEQYRIGIDLGGTNIKVGVVNSAHTLLKKASTKTQPFSRSWQAVVASMAALVNSLLAQLGLSLKDCQKLGIGCPGMVQHSSGVVAYAGNFGWENVPLVAELAKHINLPIKISNDANCAALGEVLAGAAKGDSNVVLLTLGTGVGGGVLVAGCLQQGGKAGGMELGHMMIHMNGEQCGCGRRGCLEAYASASALTRQAQRVLQLHPSSAMLGLCQGNIDNMNAAIPFTAARAGDVYAQQLVTQYISYLGEGIVNCINIWRPDKVLLGGGISGEGQYLTAPLNEYVAPRAFAGSRGYVAPVLCAALGNSAGIIGAAAL